MRARGSLSNLELTGAGRSLWQLLPRAAPNASSNLLGLTLKTGAKALTWINEHVDRDVYTLNHAACSLKLSKAETLGLIVANIANLFCATSVENWSGAV